MHSEKDAFEFLLPPFAELHYDDDDDEDAERDESYALCRNSERQCNNGACMASSASAYGSNTFVRG